MQRATLTKLALSVFGLVLLSFLVRGFGQFVVGQRMATALAGPIALLAGLVLVLVTGLRLLGHAGLIPIDPRDAD